MTTIKNKENEFNISICPHCYTMTKDIEIVVCSKCKNEKKK